MPRTPKPPLPARSCADCGTEFTPTRQQQQFCCSAHQTAFQNRAAVEGRAIIALAKAWRAGRSVKGKTAEHDALRATSSQAFSQLCTIVDGFATEDRLAGRPNPLGYAAALMADGTRFMDRRR